MINTNASWLLILEYILTIKIKIKIKRRGEIEKFSDTKQELYKVILLCSLITLKYLLECKKK